jgi:D-3-phosphoglycerate dehydrogenase / 2-oxoglutarate reductase
MNADVQASRGRAKAAERLRASRGGLVDTEALVRALDDGLVSGAALDVTDPEPLPLEHPLRRHSWTVLTAHIAYYSEEAQEDLQRSAADEVARRFEGNLRSAQ